MAEQSSDPASTALRKDAVALLGVYLVAVTLLAAYLVYEVWPRGTADTLSLFGQDIKVHEDIRLILVVMVVGGLGGNVHALKSFADYLGSERLHSSWVWWYLVRPFIGLPLALIFYFVVRAGFLSTSVKSTDINTFGVAAVSGLVGMFSDMAAAFLRRAFRNMFDPGLDDRPDRLGDGTPTTSRQPNPVPSITAIEPPTLPVGVEDVPLQIRGSRFMDRSVVRLDGQGVRTRNVNTTQLIATVPSSALKSERGVEVTVFNPPPGGGSSETVSLKVEAATQ